MERRANRPGRPRKPVDPQLAEEVRRLRRENYSYRAIGSVLGISAREAHRLENASVQNLCKNQSALAGAERPESPKDGSAPAAQTPKDAVSMITAGIDRIGRRLDRAEALLASAQARVDQAAATDAALARLDEQLARAQAGLDGYAARLHRRDALQTSIGDGLVRQTEALAETRQGLERHNTLLQSALDTLAMLPAKGAAA